MQTNATNGGGEAADIYERDIQFLLGLRPVDFGQQRRNAWLSPNDHYGKGGHLFKYASPDGLLDDQTNTQYACLTQIRAGMTSDIDKDLLRAIAADERLPKDIYDIPQDRKVLEAFAEHQRRLDAAYPGRTVATPPQETEG